jgi:hypothetical protein
MVRTRPLQAALLTLVAVLAGDLWHTGRAGASEESLAEHWQIVGSAPQQPVLSGAFVALKSLVINESLVYGERDWGINLKWDKSNRTRNIAFHREPGGSGPVKYGERVAIAVKGHGYLVYKSRDVGPNLGWAREPEYQWEIRGGMAGDAVRAGVDVGVYSRVEKDFLVYCERPLSVNLRWLRDKESKGCHGSWGAVKQAGKDAAKALGTEAARGAVQGAIGPTSERALEGAVAPKK